MATDKRLDQVSQLTDFDYALIVKGDQVAKASKQQLAELVGNLLYGATNASSLATVVAGLIGFDNVAIPKGRLEQQSFFSNSLNFRQNGIYLFNASSIKDGSFPVTSSSLWVIENKELYGDSDYLVQSLYGVGQSACYIRFVTDTSFGSWQRTDNFGYNTLAELASGVAEQNSIYHIEKTLSPQEVLNTGMSYGMLVLSAPSSGHTAVYVVYEGNAVLIKASSEDAINSAYTLWRKADGTTSITNKSNTGRLINLTIISAWV